MMPDDDFIDIRFVTTGKTITINVPIMAHASIASARTGIV